jgi:hypothetical protein
MLATCLRVLSEVHAAFFNQPDSSSLPFSSSLLIARPLPVSQRDVRYFLSKRRTSVLFGCRLIFSHCWPLGGKKPFENHLWKMAEALGAECSELFDLDSTTHVVTGSAGTEKAVVAKQSGKFVVAPAWLQACFFRWARMNEEDFPPSRPKAASAPAAHQPGGGADHELAAALAAAGG